MSDTDSFISEVNEEVRRDRLFGLLKRYGWIGALVIVLIVGGAAFAEYRKAQERAAAQAVGDAMLAALAESDSAVRADALASVPATTPGARAIAAMLAATEDRNAGDSEAAVSKLTSIAIDGDVPEIYRQIASFKALTLQVGTLPDGEMRNRFEALAVPGHPLSLLSQEQLALLEIRAGNTEAAIERYQSVMQDAGVTPDLQQRALQVIVALGGTPELETLPGSGN